MWGLFEDFYKTANRYLQTKINNSITVNNKLLNNFEKLVLNETNTLKHKKDILLRGNEAFINQKYYEIGLIETTLNKVNPTEIMRQGYTKIEQQGKSINKLENLNLEENLTINFIDGHIDAKPIK